MIAAWGSAGEELAGFEPGCRLIKIGDQVFLLHAYAGLSADQAASQEEKYKYSLLAYVQSALNFIRNVPEEGYQDIVGGEVSEGDALIIFMLNASSMGSVMGMELPSVRDVDISDGFLDLYSALKA